MPVSAVGQSASFIPDLDDSGRLQIEFSRNPKRFALNRYIKLQPVKRNVGKYLRVDEKNHSRLVGANLDAYVWADGDECPIPNDTADQYDLDEYRTIRRVFSNREGDLAREQADWNMGAVQMRTQAQKAMTARTLLVHQGLANINNWPAAHRIDVGTTSGLGHLTGALSTEPRIKRLFARATERIMLATNSVVRREDLRFVINPETARIMADTQEIIDVIKQSPNAFDMLTGQTGFTEWQLPKYLYGVELVVEDAVITTTPRQAATQTSTWVMGSAIGYFMSRPGGLASPNEGPSYSTCTLMVKEDMKVEKLRDTINRRTLERVVDDTGYASTAPISGVYCTNLYS